MIMKRLIDFIQESKLAQSKNCERIEYDNYTISTYWPKNNDNDKQYVKMNKNTIFAFLDDGYIEAGLGHFRGCNDSKHLYRNASCVRICVQNDADEILALGVYTDYRGGNKAVGYTVTTEKYLRDLGIQGLIDIIKLDINTKNKYFWTACSGAIEHMWQKYGGIRIPSLFVDEYFDLNRIKIEPISDGFHFFIYDKNNDRTEKIIFGYNSKETFDKINKYIEDSIFNSIEHVDIDEEYSDDRYIKELERKLAIFIDYVEFDGYKELPRSVIEYFRNLIDECDQFINNNPSYVFKSNVFKNNLNVCKESILEIEELHCNESTY